VRAGEDRRDADAACVHCSGPRWRSTGRFCVPGAFERYGSFTGGVLAMHGSRTPQVMVDPLTQLVRHLRDGRLESIDGLAHDGPERDAPERVAHVLSEFFGR
jgi:hypothetical protein